MGDREGWSYFGLFVFIISEVQVYAQIQDFGSVLSLYMTSVAEHNTLQHFQDIWFSVQHISLRQGQDVAWYPSEPLQNNSDTDCKEWEPNQLLSSLFPSESWILVQLRCLPGSFLRFQIIRHSTNTTLITCTVVEHTLKPSYHQFINTRFTLILVFYTKHSSTEMVYMITARKSWNIKIPM